MNTIKSDALVFYGASGDLAYKKIFPALQSMIKRGRLRRDATRAPTQRPEMRGRRKPPSRHFWRESVKSREREGVRPRGLDELVD